MKKANCSERLKELMRLRGLKQTDLIRMTRIPKSSMSNYVNGLRDPRADKLYIISSTFQIDPAWLMGYDVPMINTKTPEEIEAINNDFINKIKERKKISVIEVNKDREKVLSYINSLSKEDYEKMLKLLSVVFDDISA